MEKMNTASMITNMFVEECRKWWKQGYSKSECVKKGKEKLLKEGWYLDKNGEWKNINSGKKTEKKTSMFKNRSDENKKLASIKLNLGRRMA